MSVWVVNEKTGERQLTEPENIPALRSQGWVPEEGQQVATAGVASGNVRQRDVSEIDEYSNIASQEAINRRARDEAIESSYGDGVINTAGTFLVNTADSLSLGGVSATARALGEESELRSYNEANPYAAIGGQITGAILPAVVSGGATVPGAVTNAGRFAKLISKTPMGMLERSAARIAGGRAVAREAIVGAGVGAGAGLSQTMLSEDPVTLEAAISNISSGALYGGAFGAGGSIIGKAAEKGIGRARDALAKRAAARSADDVLEGGTDFVAAVKAHREATNESKFWIALKGTKNKELKEAAKIAVKAEKRLANILNDPKGLAAKPGFVGRTLREQETALDIIQRNMDELRAGVKPGGAKEKGLDAVEAVLERNRALQQSMDGLEVARRAAREGGESFPQRMLQGAVFSGAMGIAAPVLGGALAVPVAVAASQKLGQVAFGRLGKAAGKTEDKIAGALSRFLGKAQGRPAKIAAPLASKVLNSARFAAESEGREIKTGNKTADAFRLREREIRSQVSPGPDGRLAITADARARIADNLAGLRTASPTIADQMEAAAVARIEFLANRLPMRPSGNMVDLGGPDRWTPGPDAVAKFARYVAGVEDPAGIVERMASGSMTTEDASVLREVYPALFESLQMDLMVQIPMLRQRLNYRKQLMLSIFTGVPVAPGMDQRVLKILQGHFAKEPGSEGGTQAPDAAPQFGSVSRPEPTRAQESAT